MEYPHHLARVRDLSPVGAFLEDTRPLAPGERLQFKLWLEDTRPAVETAAVVRRRVEGQGIGVEFVEMTPADSRYLRRALTSTLT